MTGPITPADLHARMVEAFTATNWQWENYGDVDINHLAEIATRTAMENIKQPEKIQAGRVRLSVRHCPGKRDDGWQSLLNGSWVPECERRNLDAKGTAWETIHHLYYYPDGDPPDEGSVVYEKTSEGWTTTFNEATS